MDTYADPDAETRINYEAEADAILKNPGISKMAKDNIVKALHAKYYPTYETDQFNKGQAAKLQSKIDEISGLKTRLPEAARRGNLLEMGQINTQIDGIKKGFGNVPGLEGVIDPSKVVDIKLNNKAVGNARYVDGKATGNLEDVVKGLGGDVYWDKMKKSAAIYDADGNKVSTITMVGKVAIEKDMKGNIIKRYSTEGGQVQADVATYADKLGVPYSYYHDKNGVYHAYAQPDMKGAPIQVVRKEGEVTINANVEFTGKHANEIFPGTSYTYAEVAYAGILNTWNTGASYNVGGKIEQKDINGNTILVNTDDAADVKLRVNIYSRNDSPNSMMIRPTESNPKTVKINLDDSTNGWSSHVFTVNPEDYTEQSILPLGPSLPILNIPRLVQGADTFSKNVSDALSSGQLERVMNNWSYQNPGQMWLYPEATQLEQGKTAAHEFGHMLGLGDAYGAPLYRLRKTSPDLIEGENIYNQETQNEVPIYDLMRSNENVNNPNAKRAVTVKDIKATDNDITMLLKAWETGQPQFFPKEDDSTTHEIQKGGLRTIYDYYIRGLLK